MRSLDDTAQYYQRRRDARLEQINAELMIQDYGRWRAHTWIDYQLWYNRTFFQAPVQSRRRSHP